MPKLTSKLIEFYPYTRFMDFVLDVQESSLFPSALGLDGDGRYSAFQPTLERALIVIALDCDPDRDEDELQGNVGNEQVQMAVRWDGTQFTYALTLMHGKPESGDVFFVRSLMGPSGKKRPRIYGPDIPEPTPETVARIAELERLAMLAAGAKKAAK